MLIFVLMKFFVCISFFIFILSLLLNLNFGAMGSLFTQDFFEVLSYRFVHAIGAGLIGCFLALSGLVYQTVFRNPLVSPDVLGSSSGAALGIVLCLFLNFSVFFLPIFALVFGIIATIITMFIAKIIGNFSILILIITGILLSSFLISVLNLFYYLLPEQSSIIGVHYFLMGSLNSLDNSSIYLLLIFGTIGVVGLSMMTRYLDILAAPVDILITQGLRIKKVIIFLLLFSTLLSTVTVVVAGIIGWVSLIIPNIVRLFVKTNHSFLFPITAFIGGAFLLLADLVARNISDIELPIGVVTGILGTPLFIILIMCLMRKERHN